MQHRSRSSRLGATALRNAACAALAVTLFGSSVCGTAVAAEPDDEATPPDAIVYVESGERKTRSDVIVSAATHAEVKFEANGRASTLPGKSVEMILWGDAPPEYAAGWRALDRHEGAAAKTAFEGVLNAKAADIIPRDWVKEFANAGLGEALLLLGEHDKALAAFAKSTKANGKSILAGRVLHGMVLAALGKKDGPGALGHAESLAGAGRDARRPDWELDAHFLRAEVHKSTGNYGGATSSYEAAARLAEQQVGSAGDPASKARFASRQRTASAAGGWVLVEKALASKSPGDLDKASGFFDGLAAKFGSEDEIVSASENAQGVIKLARDDAAGALEHFQRVEVLHFTSPAEVARSLYYQSQCWEKLGDAEQKAARLRDLKEYFKKSEWARKL